MLLKIRTMATNFSPCKGSYVLNQFPSNVMFGMNGFHVSASGAIQGHHGPLVLFYGLFFIENSGEIQTFMLYCFSINGNIFHYFSFLLIQKAQIRRLDIILNMQTIR